MTTITKQCPECGKEVEITLYEGGPTIDGKAPPDPPYQAPNWCPACDADIEVEDIETLLYEAEQQAMALRDEYESKMDREGE